jgi:hypothetical protein
MQPAHRQGAAGNLVTEDGRVRRRTVMANAGHAGQRMTKWVRREVLTFRRSYLYYCRSRWVPSVKEPVV